MVRRGFSPRPMRPTRRDSVTRYWEWAKQMAAYGVMIFIMGLLLWSGKAVDEFVYAMIVCGINIATLYTANCKSLAPETRGALSRLSFTAHRLRARDAAKTLQSEARARPA